jgi:hypothetical protein
MPLLRRHARNRNYQISKTVLRERRDLKEVGLCLECKLVVKQFSELRSRNCYIWEKRLAIGPSKRNARLERLSDLLPQKGLAKPLSQCEALWSNPSKSNLPCNQFLLIESTFKFQPSLPALDSRSRVCCLESQDINKLMQPYPSI